jgi:predicted metal-dependent hydrolase
VRKFYGGLIQIAVSLYHLTNENPKGAKKVYEKARGMLLPFLPRHDGIDLGKLLDRLDRLFASEVNYDSLDGDYRASIPRIDFEEGGPSSGSSPPS